MPSTTQSDPITSVSVLHDHAPFPSDRARLELLRGGGPHCAASAQADAVVSVIVLAPDARQATGAAVRAALAQSHRVHEVLVVGPDWNAEVRATWATASAGDARVRFLTVPRPGLAPASPRARRFVRAAQYLRVALPYVTGDWVTVLAEFQDSPLTQVAALLQAARGDAHELVWLADCPPYEAPEASFAGTLWCAALAALPPHEHAGWDSLPPDRAWWQRLIAAGVRTPASERVA